MRTMTLDPTKRGCTAESLKQNLHRRIVGQEEAIDQIVSVYQAHVAGMTTPGRPIGNFLFLGPTGSGKTRIVEATAECLVKNPRAVIKIDCGEFQHSHEIAKLIGSPPGYLGHRETKVALSQEILDEHHTNTLKISFVLFDEIEKASDALWNLLLGILDKGTLTLGDNSKVDFSRAMIFMTSNIGAMEINATLKPTMGFAHPDKDGSDCAERNEKIAERMSKSGLGAARQKFSPEFINRLDKIVVFKPLGTSELHHILDIELNAVQQRIFANTVGRPFIFKVTERGKEFLLNEGTDTRYGARHLKRAIEKLVVQPIANLIATEQILCGDSIQIDYEPPASEMTFSLEREGVPLKDMAKLADGSVPFPAAVVTAAAHDASATQRA